MASNHPINSPEFNKEFIINHFEEFVNKKNSQVAFENLAADFYDHDEAGGPAIGPQKAKDMMEGMYRFLPDLHVTIDEIIAEGDKVMVRNIWTGTNPSGVKIQFKGFVLWKLKDGKIVERWATVTAPSPMKTGEVKW
jgi:predicted ester cyclase